VNFKDTPDVPLLEVKMTREIVSYMKRESKLEKRRQIGGRKFNEQHISTEVNLIPNYKEIYSW
jgi:hypothetical protein